MANLSKHAFGNKADVEDAKANGSVDEYDILFLDNGEVGWIDENKNTIISTPRTQSDIVVNGVTSLGIENGKIISAGATIDDIVKMLVQKAIPATYIKPTLTLTNNRGQVAEDVEVGTYVTPSLTATFTNNDAGDLIVVSINNGNDNVAWGDTSPLTYNGDAIVVGDEAITFVASATYGDAPVKNNNLGQESKENWFEGGVITSSDYTIVGKRNLFYGTGVGAIPELNSDIVRGLINKKLAPTQDYSFDVNVEIGQQHIVFAYPSDLRDVNNVTYVEANDGNMASSFTKTIIDVADARGGENGMKSYKVYSYAMAIPVTTPMTFRVTI